jgi:ferredoxin
VVKKHLFHVGYCQSNHELCIGCGECINYCITGAISLQ